ncbi:hypothetical protein BN946_scf184998.g46 [Trametes cinnabarina]|uniref:Hydrophobin n=1 Tax=Pycnoporus cinnabarinus TaxID=5643 RepID=A0A060S8E4_PYCCI|nr:hypothetical protein BN946_scf184998.g46 [Trametes cinnabarina]
MLFSSALLQGVMAKPKPAPDPLITPPPVPRDVQFGARDDPPATIPVEDCMSSLECCQQILTLPIIPASFTSLLSALLPISAPVPLPTLGPRAGLLCSAATDADILGNQCLAGGTAVCCQDSFLDIVAEGCQEVTLIPSISLPSLPIPTSLPISIPTSLPISIPTSLPISIPTSLPISLPTSLPISLPTSLPISLPTSLPISLPIGL